MTHFLGVVIGGTNTRLMLMNSQQQFRGYRKWPTQSWAGQSCPLSTPVTAFLFPKIAVAHTKDFSTGLAAPPIL